MTAQVFIDGEAGTTGLQIRARLEARADVRLIRLDDADRKDPVARAGALNQADLAILCLPDAAAREAVGLIENPQTRVIDASTAYRTDPDWTYGFPEMDAEQAAKVTASKRVSNPGCYPTGALALIRPLIKAGLLPTDFPVTINGVSGYSGGGKGLIRRYEDPAAPDRLSNAYRAYALKLAHKHLPEMRLHSGLDQAPFFLPAVGNYRQGMLVQVPLQLWALPERHKPDDIRDLLAAHFAGQDFVSVASAAETAARDDLDPEGLNGTNAMRLYVFGNASGDQVLLAAVLDNLGKGASGAAVQNMNLMLGLDPQAGLAERLAA
ncbi:N-acetyl-gamma-glutamyl-phosphate reductase [Pelagibius litoralis]|uniref:N-acetyl-gamma-glutamyl-phosphate reductase n=1 Tax=Pelagibius litoralis TaxID=374515 RepID=A0A967F2L5_9PROT|nr:N-acetyl-gamma-glutamyl-phosphate reductase [Pelagibius litoralis]NIA71887.1 N-acetyl-gamma-glutamyl-phosphate reductase [Pelagibius litoralis]